MEFPYLGSNCALKECNQLDFLPVKCDSCLQSFCVRHYQYGNHSCKGAVPRIRDNQVPICPLCSQPVAHPRGQPPDIAVGRHIDQYCKQNELLDKPAEPKTNIHPCSFKSCKHKDVIYLECDFCRLKYCIKHRYPTDHKCTKQSSSARPHGATGGSSNNGSAVGDGQSRQGRKIDNIKATVFDYLQSMRPRGRLFR